MVGKYQNEEKIKAKLLSWLNSVTSNDTAWEANNIHIDEIPSFIHIKRDQWIHASFAIFNILLNQLKLKKKLLIFLHINLSDTKNKFALNTFSLDWLNNNIHEFTPPSFNCTTLDYYENFYQKELIKCNPDSSLCNTTNEVMNWDFFYRTYFEKSERVYSRELYIFPHADACTLTDSFIDN